MKIGVIGIGFVGLPLAAELAAMGHKVICLDNNLEKIEGLKMGIIPIEEPGLAPLVANGIEHNLLKFTTSYEETLDFCDVMFVAVPTPPGEDGSADLSYVESVARTIGQKMTKPLIVAGKSTVPVGTARIVTSIIQEELNKRGLNLDFWVLSNPEFMAEGRAVKDMQEPSRIIVGSDSPEISEKIKEIYDPFMRKTHRFISMGVESAELTKYASNTMLALRISFINTIAVICEMIMADIEEVADGVGSDRRIGPDFLHASLGYGGSCFPKDVKALIAFAKKLEIPWPYIKMLESIEDVNNYQKTILARKVVAKFGNDLTGKQFALWGLSFKAKTNDMRESAAIDIIKHLVAHGATIVAYDPLAVKEAREIYLKEYADKITYEEHDKYKILDGCDALIIATETGEYRIIDYAQVKAALKNPIIIDGRNLYNIQSVNKAGFSYYAIGRAEKLDWKNVKLNLDGADKTA